MAPLSFELICVTWKWPTLLQRYQIYFVLLAGFLTQFVVGTSGTFGNLVPYIVSYIRKYSHPANLRYSDAAIILAGHTVAYGIVQLFAGRIEERIEPRLATLLGGILLSLGTALTYFTVSLPFWTVLLTYGILYGFAKGILYTGSVACVMRWSRKWKGMSSGLIMSGYGLGSLLFIPIQTAYINHENAEPNEALFAEKPDEKYYAQDALLQRVPIAFLGLGAIYAVIQITASIFLVNPTPPDTQNDEHNNMRNEMPSDSNSTLSNEISQNVSNGCTTSSHHNSPNPKSHGNPAKLRELIPKQMLTTTTFYMLYIIYGLNAPNFYIFFTFYKAFALVEVTTDDHFLSLAGIVGSTCYILNQFVWGLVCDMIGFKSSLILIEAMQACLYFTFYTTTVAGKFAFLLWFAAISFTGGTSIFPRAASDSFGEMHAGTNFSIVCSSNIPVGILAGLIPYFLVDLVQWYGLFFLCGGLMVIQLFITMFF